MVDKLILSRLFEPINIGEMTVKNRLAMSPMATSFYTKDGLVTKRVKDYYEARAKGGAGLIIIENAAVDFYRFIQASNRLAIDTDLTLPGLTELAQVIKKHGARATVQLNHAGRHSKSEITGFQPVAPSLVSFPSGAMPPAEIPRELTIEEIHEVVNLFAQAAARAKRAGFEGVEVHAAHGYLIAEFISPLSNKRHDLYGGSLENRARLLIEVLRAIRETVGDDYPLWYRINGQEYGIENGLTLDDVKTIAVMANDIVDAIHVTAWGYGRNALTNVPDIPGALLSLAEAIKKVVTVPVIAIGRLNPEVGEQAIKDGKADIIAMGRRLIADPDIPNKALSGRLEDIRPCITCFHCHDRGSLKDNPVSCAVNGAAGRESEYEIKPAKEIKKIAIIGGGPGGMEAARVLTLRGHKVSLFEKEDRLGGQLNLAMVPPHKRERIEPLITYLSTQLKKLNVEISLNTEANIELIERLQPDIVILAAGAKPVIPKLPGIDLDHVFTAIDILADQVNAGHKVVIIGGGSIGCETAELLLEREKEVTVVEMLPELAADMGFRDRVRLMTRIATLPIDYVTNARCSEIQKEGVIITKDNKQQFIRADTVVLAVGLKPNNSLLPLLMAKGFETHMAGDCWHIGRIFDAMGDGLRLGCVI
ncbi:FAD-dependent oxidoreductase [Chloroflexota bacterium]